MRLKTAKQTTINYAYHKTVDNLSSAQKYFPIIIAIQKTLKHLKHKFIFIHYYFGQKVFALSTKHQTQNYKVTLL